MLNWYLVYTKPRNEDSVAKRLVEAGFDILYPKIRERKYVRGRPKHVISPLFPCYIFVKFDIFKDYRLIKYTRGIRKIIRTGNMPTVVQDEIISSISNSMKGEFISIYSPSFEHNEEVFIKAGPFRGFEAVFKRDLKSADRVMILLKAINAHVVIDSALLCKT